MNQSGITDIAANIKQIEKLKSAMLSDVACIFEAMTAGGEAGPAIDEKLADVIIGAFLLGKKLGCDYDMLNENMLNKLKLHILSFDTPKSEYNELSNWLRGRGQSDDK